MEVSRRRRSITVSLPCHGCRKDEVYDTDKRDDLFPGVARHLGCVIPSKGGVHVVDRECRQMRNDSR